MDRITPLRAVRGLASVATAALVVLSPAASGQEAAPPGPGAKGSAPAGVLNMISRETRYPQIAEGPWTGARLPDGQPDVQGQWSNTIANHNNFTDPQGGIPGDPNPRNAPKGTREERAPSRVTDPADGKVPFQPWASEQVALFQKHFHNPTEPQYIEPLARCAPAGVPKSLYWHGYEIRQYPNAVIFLFNSGTRIIHLDRQEHLPAGIKLWNADSRGHWEGNTLVVDVANNNAKALFGRTGEFASENVHIVERYTFAADNRRYNYVATITDPTVYTRPFTITIPARRWTATDKPDGWHFEVDLVPGEDGSTRIEHPERICVENNGPFGQVAVAPRKH